MPLEKSLYLGMVPYWAFYCIQYLVGDRPLVYLYTGKAVSVCNWGLLSKVKNLRDSQKKKRFRAIQEEIRRRLLLHRTLAVLTIRTTSTTTTVEMEMKF